MKVSIKTQSVTFRPEVMTQALVKLCKTELQATDARLRDEIGRGRNADGGEIKPGGYDPSYIRQIQSERGVRGGSDRTGARKVSTQVNLTISGDLLRSIQVRQTPTGAELYFLGDHYSGMSAAQLAAILQQKGFRDWFKLGKVDLQRIQNEVSKVAAGQSTKLIVTR